MGIVTKLDPDKSKARVEFKELDEIVSNWLSVLVKKSLNDKDYWMPDINEHVVCLLDEYGEEGVILGSVYSDKDTPPISSKDKWHKTFKDGTVIEYDREENKLLIDVKGTIEIKNPLYTIKINQSGITLDAVSGGSIAGIVTKLCVCSFTGAPHPMASIFNKASL